MLKFKTTKIAEEFKQIDSRLQVMVYAIAGYAEGMHEVDVTITDAYRDNLKSVHHFWRGLDIRTRDYSQSVGDDIARFIRETFVYKYRGKPGVKFSIKDERHRPGKSKNWTGAHFHVQVDLTDHMIVQRI